VCLVYLNVHERAHLYLRERRKRAFAFLFGQESAECKPDDAATHSNKQNKSEIALMKQNCVVFKVQDGFN
jgi:hypothetical protein